MRPPKPSKASYEADALKAEIRADMNKFGRGQKPKGGKRKPPPEGGVAAKKPKKPKSPSGGSAANRAAFRKAEAEFIKNYLASRTGVKL
jgi:hypothetical protein